MTATRPAADLALACHSDHCITCGDEGIPMRVLAIDADRGLALCARTDDDSARGTVEIALVKPVAPGDRLLVHAGVALVRLEAEKEAGAAGPARAADAPGPARTLA